ncbi:HAD family hydrolase [Romboutsia sp.]|uniref:HAD family hydrolase n=1 Tax=Romboutsia sp. TaxID=1965302 RepID=UPI002D128D51|nr:HAD family hydrolase [Romboutsia sp.]HSQ89624.1 HAD family hydrolase [Romboutsia sp.]
MIKHIFCDLDGTLYHNGINKKDIAAIENIEKKGVTFNIATGRIFKQAYSMTKDSLYINGYYICENGSFIHDKNHQMIYKGTIDDDLVKKVIDRFESSKAHIYFKYDGKIVLLEDIHTLKKYTNDYIIDPKFINQGSFDNLVGNIGIVSNNEDELYRIELYLKREFDEVLDIYFTSEHTINIVPKGVSKRKSIEYICNVLDINEEEIATIGNSPNDINMLQGLKYSFAMDESRESVKESANYVVKNVAQAIEIIEKINGVE